MNNWSRNFKLLSNFYRNTLIKKSINNVIIIYGSTGTGKTTLARAVYPKATLIDARNLRHKKISRQYKDLVSKKVIKFDMESTLVTFGDDLAEYKPTSRGIILDNVQHMKYDSELTSLIQAQRAINAPIILISNDCKDVTKLLDLNVGRYSLSLNYFWSSRTGSHGSTFPKGIIQSILSKRKKDKPRIKQRYIFSSFSPN